jgi:antitoxin ParD1/3/4
MVTIDVTLPDELKAFAEAEAARIGHSTVNEYVIALLQEAERRSAKAELEGKLLSALNSPAREISDRDWDEMDRQFEQRHINGSRP